MPATSGISRADSATRSRASAPRTAYSCWCSTTAISRNSARSASPIGSGIRRPRCWRSISACRRRPSPISPSARSISPRDRCRRRFPPIRRPARSSAGRSPIATACSLSARILIRAAPIAWCRNASFQSRRPSPALMQIKPGALREPHWHPNADEWQYYISGRARMTVFGSHGRVRNEEFNAGDVGYVPQGYGHYIENIGNEDVELLIALNNGTYESISLADWIGANPHLLLATNFEVPENTFKDSQTRNRFLAG